MPWNVEGKLIMELISLSLTMLATVFFGVPALYYMYLRHETSKPWKLRIDEQYSPKVSILIPARNEEKTIELKLLNLRRVVYPKEKMQIILIDDASTDKTVQKAIGVAQNHPELDLEIIKGENRTGKSIALNNALKRAKHDVVIVTDADTFWSPEILKEALPFLSDPSIGALNGRQTLLDSKESMLTKTEKAYLDLTYGIIKLGESKIHSTIIFHGLFSAYSKKYLKEFNLRNDDSGTALDIVQGGGRTIFVPGAKCYELPTLSLKGKIKTKLRRATQLLAIYARCLRLLLSRQLRLPLRIAVPEIFIYLINPTLFILLSVTLIISLIVHPIYLMLAVVPLFLLFTVSSKSRLLFVEALQDQSILFLALLSLISRKKFSMWETLDESRAVLNEEMLKQKDLI